jgi:hypothetical protein
MKTIFSAVLVTMLSSFAFAGTKCLPYDLVGTKEISSKKITSDANLTGLQKKELWIVANLHAQQNDYDHYRDLNHAIYVLTKDHDAGGIYYDVFKYKNETYNFINAYSGDTPVGWIFKNGKLFATYGDGDSSCL